MGWGGIGANNDSMLNEVDMREIREEANFPVYQITPLKLPLLKSLSHRHAPYSPLGLS